MKLSVLWKTAVGRIIGVAGGSSIVLAFTFQTSHYVQSFSDHIRVEKNTETIPLLIEMGQQYLDHQHTIMHQVTRKSGTAFTHVHGASGTFESGVQVNRYVFPDVKTGDSLMITSLDGPIESTIEVKVTGTYPSADMERHLLVLGRNVQAALGILGTEFTQLKVMVTPYDKFHHEKDLRSVEDIAEDHIH